MPSEKLGCLDELCDAYGKRSTSQVEATISRARRLWLTNRKAEAEELLKAQSLHMVPQVRYIDLFHAAPSLLTATGP